MQTTLLAASCYAALYGIVCASGLFGSLSKRSTLVDARSRIPSFFNVAVCLFACVSLFDDVSSTLWDVEKAAFGSNPSREFYLELVSGYILWDTALVVAEFKAIGDWPMIAHHVVVFTALEMGATFKAATMYMCVLFVNEASTIPLNIRYLLLHFGLAGSWPKLYNWNGVVLAVTFMCFRVIPISFFLLYAAVSWWKLGLVQGLYWSRPCSDRWLFGCLTLLLVAHWALNIFWFNRIWDAAQRALKRAGSVPNIKGKAL